MNEPKPEIISPPAKLQTRKSKPEQYCVDREIKERKQQKAMLLENTKTK